ncbi:hypothetical protein BFS16_01655 [Hoylesella timonensis]|uniref:Uncharacterized protein n=1 Tax=Hoylesella timonensis TaxID=386414 RepID=A0A2K0XQ07_9BACT|nr:hypothetical protein BFS16_01655 [Hoylesella timonensis]
MTCRYDKRLYYNVQIYEKDWETNEEKRIKVLAEKESIMPRLVCSGSNMVFFAFFANICPHCFCC